MSKRKHNLKGYTRLLIVAKRPNKYIGGIVVTAVAAVGIVSLVMTHAAGNPVAFEPENGSLSGQASVVSNTQASGGKAVKFGVGSQVSPNAGINFHCMWGSYSDTDRASILDQLAAAKVKWVRIDMGWDGFETSRGGYDAWYTGLADKCVDMAAARGIQVLSILYLTPGWANGGQSNFTAPTNPADYGDFAGWMANHFKGRIAAYEIWNEPDPYQSFFVGTIQQYVGLLQAAYPKIHAYDPAARVVLGGPSSNDDGWIGQIYAAGAKNYFDILATHPYQGQADAPPEHPDDGNRWWFTHFPAVLAVMQNYGDGAKDVWFTEYGWSSHANTGTEPPWKLGVTEAQQGDYIVRSYKYIAANYPNVKTVFTYTDRDRIDSDAQENGYGIIRYDLQPKPAYTALKNYLSAP